MQRVGSLSRFVCLSLLSKQSVKRGNRFFSCANKESFISNLRMAYTTEERGAPYTLDYKVFFKDAQGLYVSPFHDIPLYHNEERKVMNMVVEIPRWTNAKMEIATTELMNPIKQDVKKGNLRYVHNCFPHHGYIWNYGCLPQTWEDPNHRDSFTQCVGDNDPIDVCEIGSTVHKRGAVIQVKVLGLMALIDEGETDYKVLAIDVTDPAANDLNDVDDIERHMPGFLRATNEWFRIYKIPAGKPENSFAFDGKAKDKEFALNVIYRCHTEWQNLIKGQSESKDIACGNTTLEENTISQVQAEDAVRACQERGPAEELPTEVDKWHYVTLSS